MVGEAKVADEANHWRAYLWGAIVALVGLMLIILSDFLRGLGFILTLIGTFLILDEFRRYGRWVKWYKKARPYDESKHLMHPYDPYPNVTCWNCGKFVRKPAQAHTFDKYVKPTWTRFDGRWQAFCSNCGANVTKDLTEAKYGKPYQGSIWPKFYKQSFLDMTKPCPQCGKVNTKNVKTCSACGASTKVEAD